MKLKALDRTYGRTHFGRGSWSVASQAAHDDDDDDDNDDDSAETF
jgi:hypothetical protein